MWHDFIVSCYYILTESKFMDQILKKKLLNSETKCCFIREKSENERVGKELVKKENKWK